MAVSCLDDSNFVDIKICFFTTDRIHRKSGQWQSQHSALSLVSFDIVGKTESYTDKRTSQQHQRSPEEKLALPHHAQSVCKKTRSPLTCLSQHLVCLSREICAWSNWIWTRTLSFPLKNIVNSNGKQQGHYQKVDTLSITSGTVRAVYLEEVSFSLLLSIGVFTNKDNSMGNLY